MKRVSRWRITMLVKNPSDEWSEVWTYDTPPTPSEVLVVRELYNAVTAFSDEVNGQLYPECVQLKITEIRKDNPSAV